MSEHDDRLDQRELALLWSLENQGRADRRVELKGERFVSLFLDVLDGHSYVFEHGDDPEATTEALNVGDAELERYGTADQARAAFAERLGEAVAEGRLVETDSEEDLGDAVRDAPVFTETGDENLTNND